MNVILSRQKFQSFKKQSLQKNLVNREINLFKLVITLKLLLKFLSVRTLTRGEVSMQVSSSALCYYKTNLTYMLAITLKHCVVLF